MGDSVFMGIHSFISRARPCTLAVLWIAAVASGLQVVWKYESTPGGSGAAPSRWPQESSIPRALDQATIVMLAHPRCPCTRASVEELGRIMARAQGRLRAHVLFFQPRDRPESWSETPLRSAAAAIPGVTVGSDKASLEARRFAAETSGHVVLYDRDGRLLFAGGITGLRGHAGDNAGRRAIEDLLAGVKSSAAGTPVFGCSLEGPVLAGGKSHDGRLQNN